MGRPLVSVITPTWQRHNLLLERCMPSVIKQTHPEIEHVIVSDGPDEQLWGLLSCMPGLQTGAILYEELPEHDLDQNNYGNRARNCGLEVATGRYVAYLDDDNAFRPMHIERLVSVAEAAGVDFAYSRMEAHRNGSSYEVGVSPPIYGGIDSSLLLHRKDAVDRFGSWIVPSLCQHCPDWELVESWLHKGATWIFVPEVTVDYYAP